MKRDKSVIWYGALLSTMVTLTFVLSSCIKEPLGQSEQPDKEYMDFSLELTPPGAFTSAQTRAMSTAQQNAVNRAEVLVFENNTLLYHKTGTVTDIDGVKKRVVVNLKTSQSESDLFDIMVIGNPPTGFNFTPYVGKTKDELKAGFNVMVAGRWPCSEFVMYGEALQALIKPTTNNFKIQMLRSLARVDIGVGAYDEATDSWAGLAGVFSLTEVRVVNSRDRFAVIPSAVTFSENSSIKVSEPTISSGTEAQGTTAATAITYSGSDIISEGGEGRYIESTIFLAEAPNTTPRVTLLIGGSYMGETTTFYRVDMLVPRVPSVDASFEYDYINILRNHLYRISITGVTASGYTTPEEALTMGPVNMITMLTPIEEGDTGDMVFDGYRYIMTDVSNVQVYGNPDGVKEYPLFTVKAKFVPGVTTSISGMGITSPLTLESGVAKTVSIVIPAGVTTGILTIRVGSLTKVVEVAVQSAIDAHFDFLPFANTSSITILDPKPWISLSLNDYYVKNEQQSVHLVSNTGKAYIYFDENIATTGEPRMSQAIVRRSNNMGSTRVCIEQLNLNGMVVGYFGGAYSNDGYTKQLAIESVEEFSQRIYDDTSIGTNRMGFYWGFFSIGTDINDNKLGYATTLNLAKRTDSDIPGPHTIYNNYAARYCYDKNRDIDGDGVTRDDEIVWYLPAKTQLVGIAISWNTMKYRLEGDYWSATEHATIFGASSFTSFTTTGTFFKCIGCTYVRSQKSTTRRVRCVRDL